MSKVNKFGNMNVEEEILHDISIHKKWRKEIVRLAKEQVSQIDEPEDWQDILESWSWFIKPHPWILVTLNLLAKHPATSAYLLAVEYLFEQGEDMSKHTHKGTQILAARFRRAIHKIHMAQLLVGVPLRPEDVGPGRKSVTIWITPWAKEKDIEKVKNFYLNLAEGRPGKENKTKKKPAELTHHNRKMKVLSMLDAYLKVRNLHDFYKCPKKHSIGLKSAPKVKSYYKRKTYPQKCPECGRNLIEVLYEEFIELKRKELYKQWNIKE